MNQLVAKYRFLTDRVTQAFGMQDYLLLFLRIWIAKIFYLSGRSKVGGGFLTPSDLTVMLFEEEYALPYVDPVVAAHMALYAETFLPIMLMVGLGSRLAAAGLMGMTLVIQFFVYPGYFPEHATWVAALLPVVMMGPGRLSLDRLLALRIVK